MPSRKGQFQTEITKDKIRKARKGTHLLETTKQKIRDKRKLQIIKPFSIIHKKNISEALKGRPSLNKNVPMKEEQKKKIAETLRNKPGIRKTKLYEQIRMLPIYIHWRLKVFIRDNFTCQGCRRIGGELQAHHIKSFSDILKDNNIKTIKEALLCEELWDINNGVTLCIDCHKETDSYFSNKKI
jgi:hypothetical protein